MKSLLAKQKAKTEKKRYDLLLQTVQAELKRLHGLHKNLDQKVVLMKTWKEEARFDEQDLTSKIEVCKKEYVRFSNSFYSLLACPDIRQIQADLDWTVSISSHECKYDRYKKQHVICCWNDKSQGGDGNLYYTKSHSAQLKDENWNLIEIKTKDNKPVLNKSGRVVCVKAIENREELQTSIPAFLSLVYGEEGFDNLEKALDAIAGCVQSTLAVVGSLDAIKKQVLVRKNQKIAEEAAREQIQNNQKKAIVRRELKNQI